MPRPAGVKLISQHGHSVWSDPTVRDLPGGYGMGIACDLGGVRQTHWLVPDPDRAGHFMFANTPYTFDRLSDALDALERYRRQQE